MVKTNSPINVKQFIQSFRAGAQILIDNRTLLNKINVFPVADSDTGNNLSILMQTIIDQLSDSIHDLDQALHAIANAALEGARGNSGMIFAQYLNGIAEVFNTTSKLNLEDLTYSLSQAVLDAYAAVETPQEGTMITLMRIWGESLHKMYVSGLDFNESLQKALEVAYKGLQETPQQLKLLQKYGVVDAGAQGFYLFLEGFTNSYSNHKPVDETFMSTFETLAMDHPTHDDLTQRYCMELIVNGRQERSDIHHELKDRGDSLVIVTGQDATRVHIHTDTPHLVMEIMESVGTIRFHKVDDMSIQSDVTKHQKYPIAIVTDSIADIPQSLLDQEQVHVLPMHILIETHSYLDRYTVTNKQMFAKLDLLHTKATSSQPSPKTITALADWLEQHYESALFITVSKTLSGTYQRIRQTLAQHDSSMKTYVLNSKLNSAAQGLLIAEAIRLRQMGHDFTTLCDKLEQQRANIFIYVAVSDLNPMIQSGRIPVFLGKFAQILGLKPIISLDADGKGKIAGVAFTDKGLARKIVGKVRKAARKTHVQQLAYTYTTSPVQIKQWRKELEDVVTSYPSFTTESSSVIALSAGKNSSAVAILHEKGNPGS